MIATSSAIEATLVSRENKFRARVAVEGKVYSAHVPNSGRLNGIFVPGRRAWLRMVSNPGRLTVYDLVAIQDQGVWVSVDTRLSGRLLEEAIRAGQLSELAGYSEIIREVKYGNSRLDLALRASGVPDFMIEVKSVTLVEDGIGYFPDAVTDRGRRHLRDLVWAKEAGKRAALVFIVQREDAESLSPYHSSDPLFGPALVKAVSFGVEVYAYRCQVNSQEIKISATIPVLLSV